MLHYREVKNLLIYLPVGKYTRSFHLLIYLLTLRHLTHSYLTILYSHAKPPHTKCQAKFPPPFTHRIAPPSPDTPTADVASCATQNHLAFWCSFNVRMDSLACDQSTANDVNIAESIRSRCGQPARSTTRSNFTRVYMGRYDSIRGHKMPWTSWLGDCMRSLARFTCDVSGSR